MEISQRIKKLRSILNLNQQEFAKKLNMKRNSISLIENDKRNPSERTLLTISEVMGVNINWLKYGKGEIFKNENKFHIYIDELSQKYNIGYYGKKIIEYYLLMNEDEKIFTEKIIENFITYCNKDEKENEIKNNMLKIITEEKNNTEMGIYYDLIPLNYDEEIKKELIDYKRQLEEEKKGQILSVLQNTKGKNSKLINLSK